MSDQRQTITVPFRERSEWVAFFGAVVLVLGSFMTWAVAGPFRAAGTDGDGWFTAIGGVAAAVQLWRGRHMSAAIWAGLAFALVIWKFADIESAAEDTILEVSPGGGLYLCAIGAGACVWASALRWWRLRSSPDES